MDAHSSFLDMFINEQLHEAVPLTTGMELPYMYLLYCLHFLNLKNEISPLFENLRHEIWTLQRELRLQQMIFKLLQNHGFMTGPINNILAIAEAEAKPIKEAAWDLDHSRIFKPREQRQSYFDRWKSSVSKFLAETIDKKMKPHLREFILRRVDWLLQGNSSSDYDIVEFIYIILLKLKDLEKFKPNIIAPVKKQMETLEEMLHFVYIMARKKTNLDENLRSLLAYFQRWVNVAAALAILYWIDKDDDKLFAVVYPSLQKLNLSILELVEMYIVVIKAVKPTTAYEIRMMRETVGRFTNIVLQNLTFCTDDHFEMLGEGLTLWIALLMDPPQADTEEDKLICAQTNLLVEEAESLIRSLCSDKLGDDISKGRNILVNDLLEKINKAKAEVRELHVKIPAGMSLNTIPQTNGWGFFDFLLGNLQKKLESETDMFPFEKHLIAIVHKKLSLPFLMDIFELQDDHKELRDICVRASNIAYLVDYVTDSCLSSIDVPIWSNLMHLYNAIEEIQFVDTEVSKFRRNDQMHKNRVNRAKVNSKLVPPGQQQASETNKDAIKLGFADEEQRIIDRLTAGEVGLDIVAIVGMPGQGKTYLAQRVFQNSCIKNHFYKYAWCCISQAYDIKRILLDILENLGEHVSLEKCEEDLADQLRKCLKGQRYLIVLDDVWDAKALHELKLSFPNDDNGSRILLTSRIRNVALQAKAKADCYIVELHPLLYEESWDLLRMKVFEEDLCPPSLSDIGKTIAQNCKGLPLAIVVVAGLLKKDKNVDSWIQIYENLTSQIASKGCMNILDLSYKHLPDYLRPCFLYLGAFHEDQVIDAKLLIQLWIAEGFVMNNGAKSMEVVAEEYLIDLVARSLVLVAQRSSRNGIKKCHVHDLLHQFCLIKAEEERFLLVPKFSARFSSIRYDHYRLCVHKKWSHFLRSKHHVPSLRSLLVSVSRDGYNRCAPGFLEGFKLIKVLDLSYVRLKQADFHQITQFIHLQLLAVTCSFSIPSMIINLLRLEILRCQYVGASFILPIAVIKMVNLRHIFVTEYGEFEYIEDFDKIVRDMCPLTNFETFTSVKFDSELSFEKVAQKLPNILKLGLRVPFCVRLSSYFKRLESLTLHISWPKTEAISPSKLDFHLTLKKLNLQVKSSALSGAMISSIGKLSNLEVLKLHRVDFEDERWNVEDDEFLKLKYIEFTSRTIQEWNVSDESFPCLEQLVVKNCDFLMELPDRFGAITTLKRIEVCRCNRSVKNSFQQIVGDQIDSGNEKLQYSISDLIPRYI